MKKELEEVAKNESEYLGDWQGTDRYQQGFIEGAKRLQERMYSEEEVKHIIEKTLIEYSDYVLADIPKWFEKFKKK